MSGRVRVRCRVAVTLEAPFLMRGLEGLGFGVDAAQLRDRSGRAVIPGDQLKGLLRQAVRDLAGTAVAPDEKDLFGRAPKDALGQPGDERGHLVVSDLVAACLPTSKILPRVAIDGETGSARSGHLLMIESTAPIGAHVTFEGGLVVFVDLQQGSVDDTVRGLRAALQLVPAIGAMETAGFGRVVEAVLEKTAEEPLVPPSPAARQGGRLAWSFGFDRPLLVSAERLEDNVLVGAEVIAGAVLKGALARRLELAGKDPADFLCELHVGHAFPGQAGREHGRALPVSLVTDRKVTQWEDALRWDGPLFADGGIPLFSPDWKGDARAQARQRLGIGGGIDQVTRTRTAIDPEHGRADEGNLFSFRMIDPTDVRWRAVIDTGRLGGDELQVLLAILAEGLDGIGKTDAAMVEPALGAAADPEVPLPVPGTTDCYALMLETPALLIDTPALQDATTLRTAFEDYFKDKSGQKLVCTRFFAKQCWAGGIVALKRDPYRPFVLVDAGSCFLLQGDPAPIGGWLRRGLPLPQWAIDEGLDWQRCRYLPDNGFAAVSLNRARPFWGVG